MPTLSRFCHSGKSERSSDSTDKDGIELNNLSEKGKQPGDAKADDVQIAPWRALFFFTTSAHLPCLMVSVVSAIFSGLASPAAALLQGKAFQGFATETDVNALVRKESKYALYIFLVGLGSWLLHYIFFAAWVTFGELQANSARDRLFNGMLIKEIEWYDLRKNGVGALIPRLQVQIRDLQLATAQPFGSLITTVATAVFNIGLAMYYSWKLTLVIISTVPLITFVLGYLGASMQPHVKKQQEKLAEASKHVNNALHAIEAVKCFNGQESETKKYAMAVSRAATWYMRVVNTNALQFAFTSFMASAMFIQGFCYGGVLVRDGEKNTGDVVTTFVAALGAFQAIAGVLPQMIVLEKGRTAGATLRAVMTQIEGGPAVIQDREVSKLDSCEGNINLKNVSFAYPTRPDQMVLRDVTMFIPGSATTFIIGKSGSGKSTLGQLLLRFYTPELGEILFDDVPLSRLDPTWLRSHITLVEQNSTLFEDTVFNNIALGRVDHHTVAETDVLRATEFALLQFMINDMPKGIETTVSAKGNSMSGGQRQRMTLARAFVRNSPVLILDESTSALDQVSRSLIMDALREWRKGKTTIIITHDISQISPNDYAIVFEQGRLVQEGYRRHIERVKGSPFQHFLSEDEQKQLSPYNPYRHRSVGARSGKKLGMYSNSHEYIVDPLEDHLSAGEAKHASFLPAAFTNTHTSMALQRVSRFGRPVSTLMPAFSYISNGPASSPTATSNSTRSSDRSVDVLGPSRKVGRLNGDMYNGNSMTPNFMETFLDMKGSLAARTRLQSNRQRRRLHSEPSIMLEPVKAKRHILPKKFRRFDLRKHREADDTKAQSVAAILKTVWPSLEWSVRVLMVLGFLCAAIGAAVTPVFSFILSKLIETYAQGSAGQHKALIYSLSILGIAGVTASCAFFQHVFLEYAAQRWVNRIREKALERVLDQPREFFDHEENSVSRITEGLDRHAEEMRNLVGRFAATVLTATIMVLVSLIWALITQWKMTLIALSVSPYVWAVTRAFGAVSGKWEARSNDASEAAGAIFFETFTSIKTVRALTLEKHFSEKYFRATRVALIVGIKRASWTGFFFGLSDVSGDFVMALIFYAGAVLVREGAPATQIIQVFIQLIITINQVSNLLGFIPQMSASRDVASRILRLSQLPRDSHEHLGHTRVTAICDIVFTGLDFSYPSRPDQKILKNTTFLIASGKCTAIVGSSGSGKSTIAALLLNLYTTPPDAPSSTRSVPDLMVSGRDIKHIHTPTLRALVTIVAQTPVIFSLSVAENISYGLPPDSPHNNMPSIRDAAVAAGIDDFIMALPEAYATLVGEGGIGISGGQAQRISIARALVRKPAVLILDEATSALDGESARLVRNTVRALVQEDGGSRDTTGVRSDGRAKMTVVIITHSKDMMAIAENVVVLDRGEVVEQGGYGELVASKSALSHLLSGGEWEGDGGQVDRKSSAAVEGLTSVVDWGR